MLSQLPVYVRAGSIVPLEPLVQSTSETPAGPLTLRIYAGDNCAGQVYQDDGRSFAFEKGEFLRETFACEVKDGSLRVTIGPRAGTYPAWWKEVRFEIYGWTPSKDRIVLNGTVSGTQIDHSEHGSSFTVTDDGKLSRIEVQ